MDIQEEYYQAIINDDLDKLIQLTKEHPNYNYVSHIGQGLLKSLYLYNAFNALDFFLAQKIDLNFTESWFSESILDDFITGNKKDNINYVIKLLENNANPNGNLLANEFPLNSAFYNLSKIKLENPNIDILKNDEYIKNKEIIKVLLNYGANPNLVLPSLCQTLLDRCDRYGLDDIAELLLEHNANRAREQINFDKAENNGVLDHIQSHIGQILNFEYYYNDSKILTLRTALINQDSKLKLLFTNGLYKSTQKCELLFAIDSYIPIHQELINSQSKYNFFSNVLFRISEQITNNLELYEGMIFDENNLSNISFPNNIDGLMLIDYVFSTENILEDENSINLWLLLPFKYPKSGKFSASNLKKFIEKNRITNWKKVAYWLETDDETDEYLEIY